MIFCLYFLLCLLIPTRAHEIEHSHGEYSLAGELLASFIVFSGFGICLYFLLWTPDFRRQQNLQQTVGPKPPGV